MHYKIFPQTSTCELIPQPDRKSASFKDGFFRYDPANHTGKELILEINDGVVEIYVALVSHSRTKKV